MKNYDERIELIAKHYGTESQLSILQEECAELIQAVSKYRRGISTAGIIEEIADVQIMCEQIIYLLKIQDEVAMMETAKIQRQVNRMNAETQPTDCFYRCEGGTGLAKDCKGYCTYGGWRLVSNEECISCPRKTCFKREGDNE